MSTTGGGAAPVKKSTQSTCVRCGLKAASPMVVANGKTRGVDNTPLGVCSNVGACERRVRIAAARTPKATP